MKTMSLFRNCVVILLFAGLSVNVVTAQTTKTEQVTTVYDIVPSGSLILSSFDQNSSIEILTWDRNEVKIVSELTYTFIGSEIEKDFGKVFNAFKEMNAESSKEVLKLNLTLITSTAYDKKPFQKPIITRTLRNGDKILIKINTNQIRMIQTAYTIWIPTTLSVKVNSRYGKLKMASIHGDVDFTLDRNDLEMGNFGESGIFNINYSSATIGSGGTSKFNAYGSNVNAAELKNLTIDTRNSKFNIAKSDNVSLKSYSDNFVFGIVNDIDASATYSTIRIENNAGNSKFDFFNSKLFGKNFQTMEISARSSEINVADVGDMKINVSNNNKFNCATVSMFNQQHIDEDDFSIIQRDNDVFIFDYIGAKQNVSIPPLIQGKAVIFIGANSFANKNLTSVTIPNIVTSIRAYAFLNNNLTSIVIPNNITDIWATAFVRNPITRITIGVNVQFQSYTDSNGIRSTVAFDNGFDAFYITQGRKAGTYTYNNGRWSVAEQ